MRRWLAHGMLPQQGDSPSALLHHGPIRRVLDLRRRMRMDQRTLEERLVQIPAGAVTLEGNLSVPEGARGVVLFAHGSGSSRHSPRNRYVAGALREVGLATLLMDLLTADEEAIDLQTRRLRFDIGLLADRLVGATDWLAQNADTLDLTVGY